MPFLSLRFASLTLTMMLIFLLIEWLTVGSVTSGTKHPMIQTPAIRST